MKRLKRQHLRHLKSEEIEKVASQAKSHGALVQFKVMVNFFANWGGTCEKLEAELSKLNCSRCRRSN